MSTVILNLHNFLSAYNTPPTMDLTYMLDRSLPFSVKFCYIYCTTILCVVLYFPCLIIFLAFDVIESQAMLVMKLAQRSAMKDYITADVIESRN